MNPNQQGPETDQTVCRNPATGEILGYSTLTPVEEIKEIIARARSAQHAWGRVPVKTRVKHMLRVRDFLAGNAGQIAEVISRDNGKTRVDALNTEVLPAAMAVDYYAKHARRFLKKRHIPPGNTLLLNKLSGIIRVPYGVIGIISPWNYPFAIPFSEIVMGLLAGNAVVVKTATQTQMVGRKLEECFSWAALPEGTFNYVNIPGRVAGKAFLESGIDKLFFTGSVKVGKELMREAAATLTPLVLELGGNDPMLVCEDANLHRAAAGAVWAGLSNCGQSCAGVERAYVHRKIYKPFLELLKERVERLRIGYDEDFNVDLGVMTTEGQISTVKRHLEDALEKGAVIYAQSKIPEGGAYRNLLPAVVLTDVTHEMLVMREETFGPILPVMEVTDMAQAVALANDSHLGLTGSVWSGNRVRAERLARQIQAGVVTINDHLMSHGMAESPWGGFKQSGIGRTHGRIGFDEMSQPQVIIHDMLAFAGQNLWWHPYDKQLFQGILGSIRFFYGLSIRQRLKGLYDLVSIVPRYFSAR